MINKIFRVIFVFMVLVFGVNIIFGCETGQYETGTSSSSKCVAYGDLKKENLQKMKSDDIVNNIGSITKDQINSLTETQINDIFKDTKNKYLMNDDKFKEQRDKFVSRANSEISGIDGDVSGLDKDGNLDTGKLKLDLTQMKNLPGGFKSGSKVKVNSDGSFSYTDNSGNSQTIKCQSQARGESCNLKIGSSGSMSADEGNVAFETIDKENRKSYFILENNGEITKNDDGSYNLVKGKIKVEKGKVKIKQGESYFELSGGDSATKIDNVIEFKGDNIIEYDKENKKISTLVEGSMNVNEKGQITLGKESEYYDNVNKFTQKTTDRPMELFGKIETIDNNKILKCSNEKIDCMKVENNHLYYGLNSKDKLSADKPNFETILNDDTKIQGINVGRSNKKSDAFLRVRTDNIFSSDGILNFRKNSITAKRFNKFGEDFKVSGDIIDYSKNDNIIRHNIDKNGLIDIGTDGKNVILGEIFSLNTKINDVIKGKVRDDTISGSYDNKDSSGGSGDDDLSSGGIPVTGESRSTINKKGEIIVTPGLPEINTPFLINPNKNKDSCDSSKNVGNYIGCIGDTKVSGGSGNDFLNTPFVDLAKEVSCRIHPDKCSSSKNNAGKSGFTKISNDECRKKKFRCGFNREKNCDKIC